ncbi:exo-beta-N-acetylmuramidase NamZ domain-containing protein [Adhaeribacter terreus]|uniref:Exo-beta-N-acetylmuramidase NamZ domain-containing protein n=1 Tax=Adhaeribacter terreus TaxID=529703 RepID=A0ABW0EFF4_9BACT
MFQPLIVLLSVFLLGLPSCQKSTPNNSETVGISTPKPEENDRVSGQKTTENATQNNLKTGAEQTEKYLPLLRGKKIALVVNQTSLIKNTHLVDSLLAHKIQIVKIFAPEHGFRGEADAGAHIKNETDAKTGLPLVSLYGKNKKPTAEQLKDIDLILFDIQDVGVRFYTYISTLHYIMEAAAENNKTVLVLDRPNPNGDYVDGPVLEKTHVSFVGMHEIPLVHGLTVAELAKMLNGEKWLEGGKQCKLEIVPVKNYTHKTVYELPVKPSPNLPNYQSIRLYPSLGLFEGTNVSAGRGTDKPFQILGSPFYKDTTFSFIPKSIPGATNPPHLNVKCYGKDLSQIKAPNFTLSYLIDFYKNSRQQEKFFNSFLTKLAGTEQLRKQIEAGLSEEAIRKTWQPALNRYKVTRKKYLLYPDFE